MTGRGWYGQSYRHHLAAKGVKTNRYMAKKSLRYYQNVDITSGGAFPLVRVADDEPVVQDEQSVGTPEKTTFYQRVFGVTPLEGRRKAKTRREELVAQQQLTETAEDIARKTTEPTEIAVESLARNNPREALRLLSAGNLSSDQRDLLTDALGQYAVRLAQAGQEVPEFTIQKQSPSGGFETVDLIDPNVRKQISAIQREQTEFGKGALRRKAEELGKEATLSLLSGGIAGAKGIVAEPYAEFKQLQSEDFPGILDQKTGVPALGRTPLSDGNEIRGGDNFFLTTPEPLSKRFDFVTKGQDVNIALKQTPNDQLPTVERVQREVDQLHQSRKKIADVDLSAYDKGNKAFEHGDREEMIRAIAELQSQEAKLKDRWDLLQQTQALVTSFENRATAMQKNNANNAIFRLGSGGDIIADQTEKLADVRGEVVKANNAVFGRRRMLEFRLQRLDSVVPPESSVPKMIKRFSGSGGNGLIGVNNPVIQ